MGTQVPVSVVPVVLGQTYCPTSYQELNLAIMRAKWSVDLGSVSTVITSAAAPDELTDPNALWIKTENGVPVRAYQWNENAGRWLSKHPVPPGGELRMWTGTLPELKLYEGDAASSITPVANPTFEGPFWEPVLELSGRTPIGVNDATVGGPDETLPKYALGAINVGTVDDPLGTLKLTLAQIPIHGHVVGKIGPIGGAGNSDDLYIMGNQAPRPLTDFKGPSTTKMWAIPGDSGAQLPVDVGNVDIHTFDATELQVAVSTRTIEKVGVITESSGVPVRGVYFIRRTAARLYYSEL